MQVIIAPIAPATSAPTGTVSFFANGQLVATLNLVGGSAALYVTKAASLNKTYTVMYNGDANYQISTSKSLLVTQAVQNAGPIPILV